MPTSSQRKDLQPSRSSPWWPRAELRRDEDFDLERKVSWLELFFDLVFVVVMARLAHDLAHHPDANHTRDFFLLFAAVFWAWNAFTYYIERFESGGIEQRFFMFLAMGAVAALALWTEGGLSEHYTGFARAYIAVRTVNMVQWTRAALHVAEFRPVARRFVAGFAVTAALLLVADGLSGGQRRLLFAVAILIDILTPLFTLKKQASLPQLSTSKFPERFGLFTILVLGESVVGAIAAMSELNESGDLTGRHMIDGALGLAVGIGLWWIYFDFIARRPPRPSLGAALGWAYLHLISLAAITATGAAISLVAADTVSALSPAAQRLLSAAVAAALLGLAALELTLDRDIDEPTHGTISPAIKASVGVAIFGLGWIDLGWTSTYLLGVVVAGLAVPAIYGATVWYSADNAHRLRLENPLS